MATYKTSDEISKELKSLTDYIAKQSKSADESWQGISSAIEKSTKSMQSGWIGALSKFFGMKSTATVVSTTLIEGFKGSTAHVQVLYAELEKVRKEAGKLLDPFSKKQSAEYKRLEKQAKAAYREAEAHAALSKTVGDVLKGRTGAAAAVFLSSMALAVKYSKEINESLIDANSSYAVRAKLSQQISSIQAVTGNEMADMAKAAKALTAYGFDIRDGFKDTLKTVVLMEEGLGVSYESSAKLAVITKRVGGNFTDIANSIARIKADTALTADEATRMAEQIGRAVMLLKPGSGTLLSQTTDYISRIAAALKELTGNGQGFVDMLASFTTEQGMMGAATLGATPDFLASPAMTKKVTENFVKYVNQQLSGTSGFQRMATIQLLAEQFNTSADVIANADEMLKKYNETQKNATGLQEQWRQQTAELTKTLSKIANSFRAVIQESLLPIINTFLRPALGAVADSLQWVAKHSWAVKAAGVALVGTALYAAVAFVRLSAAIAKAAAASIGYESILSKGRGLVSKGGSGGINVTLSSVFSKDGAKSLARFLRTDIMTGKAVPISKTSVFTKGIASVLTTWLPRIGTVLSRLAAFIAGPLLAIAGAAAAGAAAGFLIDKGLKKMGYDLSELARNTRKDTFREMMLSTNRGSMNRDELLRQVSAMAGSGASAEAIQNYVLKNINKLRGMHIADAEGRDTRSAEWRQKIVAGILEDVGGEITRQRSRLGYTTLTARTLEDKERDERMIKLFKDVAMNTAFTNQIQQKVASRSEVMEDFRKRERDEYETEERLRRQQADDLHQGRWGYW